MPMNALTPCLWCNYANHSPATFCGGCGRSLRFDTVCPACAAENPAGHPFCDACGTRIAIETQAPMLAEEPVAEQGPHPLQDGLSKAPSGGHSTASEPALSPPKGATDATLSVGGEPLGELGTGPVEPQLGQADTGNEKAPLRFALSREKLWSWAKKNKWEIALVAALTLVAAFVRVYRLADLPPGLHGDEAWTGIEALRILDDGPIGVWSPSAIGQPAGTFYWTAFFFSFLKPGLLTLRLSIAILGVLTIPAFYLFARALLGWRAAAIGAALLSISFWHIHYSRIAFVLVALPLLVSIALFLLVKGLRDGRVSFLVAAGAVSALGVYVYGGFVSFALTLIMFWVFLALRRTHPPAQLLKFALAFGLPAFLVALPFIRTLVFSTSDVLAYGGVSSTFNDHAFTEAEDFEQKVNFVLGRLRRGFTLYSSGGRIDFTDGMGARGLLDPLAVALVLVGGAVALWQWRDWRRFLLLAGLLGGVMVTAYMALPSWAESRRGIGALPVVFALAGLGGDSLLRLAGRWIKLRWAYAVLGAVLLIAAYVNLNYYFGTLSGNSETRWVFVEELTRASRYVDTLPDDDLYVYFYSARWSYNYETRRFLLPDLPGEDRSREFGHFTLERDPNRSNVVYVLLPPYEEVSEELRALYPGGSYHELKDGDRFIFSSYHLKEGE